MDAEKEMKDKILGFNKEISDVSVHIWAGNIINMLAIQEDSISRLNEKIYHLQKAMDYINKNNA